MATLLIRLYGPMQSWGTTSRFDERDTQLEPSKSGVVGLICAALGRDRAEPVEDIAHLRMGIRVDREGIPMRDYQTAKGVVIASSGKPDLSRTVVSPRYFLADAVFLVGLEGSRELLVQIQAALLRPHWPLALGRKSFVPSMPVYLTDALLDLSLEAALEGWPCLVTEAAPSGSRRLLVEHVSEGSVRLDQPVGPFSQRRFGPRFVQSSILNYGGTHVPDSAAA